MKERYQIDIWILIICMELYTIAKRRKHSKCLTTNEWIKNNHTQRHFYKNKCILHNVYIYVHMYIVKYYLAIRNISPEEKEKSCNSNVNGFWEQY